MTPTEQDKELFENSFGEWLENHGVELSGNNPSHLGTWQAMVDMNELKLAIVQLITADRKRVALEARIEALDHVIDLQDKQFSRWTQMDIANFFDGVGKYYRELKAQQEEV